MAAEQVQAHLLGLLELVLQEFVGGGRVAGLGVEILVQGAHDVDRPVIEEDQIIPNADLAHPEGDGRLIHRLAALIEAHLHLVAVGGVQVPEPYRLDRYLHGERTQRPVRLARLPQCLRERHAVSLPDHPAGGLGDLEAEGEPIPPGGRGVEADPDPRAARVHVRSDEHAGEEDRVDHFQVDALPDAADGSVPVLLADRDLA